MQHLVLNRVPVFPLESFLEILKRLSSTQLKEMEGERVLSCLVAQSILNEYPTKQWTNPSISYSFQKDADSTLLYLSLDAIS